jgi:hypothetical protein
MPSFEMNFGKTYDYAYLKGPFGGNPTKCSTSCVWKTPAKNDGYLSSSIPGGAEFTVSYSDTRAGKLYSLEKMNATPLTTSNDISRGTNGYSAYAKTGISYYVFKNIFDGSPPECPEKTCDALKWTYPSGRKGILRTFFTGSTEFTVSSSDGGKKYKIEKIGNTPIIANQTVTINVPRS